jgi:hypothetical protein
MTPPPAGWPVGHAWLREAFDLNVPPPRTLSYVRETGARRTEVVGPRTYESYPASYAPDDEPTSHLKFALRHEPTDLGVLVAVLKRIPSDEMLAWHDAEPTGKYFRKAWFLYERFAGRTLDVPDATMGNYVPLLDPKRHVVGNRRDSRRHRVSDNLLGGPALCPVVRRTPTLEAAVQRGLDRLAQKIVEAYDPADLMRAVSYLYTKETRSSFAIENELPSPTRTERFVQALRQAFAFDASAPRALVTLQGEIEDPRYAADGWRDLQTFIGSTVAGYREEVHYVCPRPEDVPELMGGWFDLYRRCLADDVHPVVAAAATSFAFVLIHPFEDGNGRIHRFLIHNLLARHEFGPKDVILPVSAAILRDRRGYDEVLAGVSAPVTDRVSWTLRADGTVAVEGDTVDLYRFFDATSMCEFLFDRLADAVERDLSDELTFLTVFDRATRSAREVVDMPDRRLSLFVRLVLQNGGHLSERKRPQFEELSDEEVAAMEAAVRSARDSAPGTREPEA